MPNCNQCKAYTVNGECSNCGHMVPRFVYWCIKHQKFYCMTTGESMTNAFYKRWSKFRQKFPQSIEVLKTCRACVHCSGSMNLKCNWANTLPPPVRRVLIGLGGNPRTEPGWARDCKHYTRRTTNDA